MCRYTKGSDLALLCFVFPYRSIPHSHLHLTFFSHSSTKPGPSLETFLRRSQIASLAVDHPHPIHGFSPPDASTITLPAWLAPVASCRHETRLLVYVQLSPWPKPQAHPSLKSSTSRHRLRSDARISAFALCLLQPRRDPSPPTGETRQPHLLADHASPISTLISSSLLTPHLPHRRVCSADQRPNNPLQTCCRCYCHCHCHCHFLQLAVPIDFATSPHQDVRLSTRN